MKIRTGFVSNSSSSSFIIHTDLSVKALTEMIKSYETEFHDEYPKSKKNPNEYESHIIKIIHKIKKFIKHNKTSNIGFILRFTCNYETFILPSENNKVQVYTCNNHNWDINLPTSHYSDDYLYIEDISSEASKIEFYDFELETSKTYKEWDDFIYSKYK